MSLRLLLAVLSRGRLECNRIAGTNWARFRLGLRSIRPGHGFSVTGRLDLSIHRTAQVTIGSDCRILSSFSANSVGGFRRAQIWVGPGGVLTIGNRVGLSNCTIVCMQSVTIEDGAMIGGDAKIYDTDFHSINAVERARSPDPGVRKAPVRIGRNAFVGGHSILLKGVILGSEAVIGAGSVVTRSVPAGETWAGNPARRLRKSCAA